MGLRDDLVCFCLIFLWFPCASARDQVIPGFKTDLEDRREAKLLYLRRRGKGPPKKGSGARSKKK
jgi:uncharacterized protein YihD (DUF1040 family)